MRSDLDATGGAVGRAAGAVRIAPYVTAAVIGDESERAAARRQARAPIAFYVGKMGTFYASMLRRHGFEEDVEAIKRGWETGHASALDAVSDRLLDATAMVGTALEVAAKLADWRARGVDQPLISMPSGSVDEAAGKLQALADALRLNAG